MNYSQKQSLLFVSLLIVLIVYIHNQGMGTPLGEVSVSWANFSGIDTYNLLRLVITEVIARAAVPAFFILSGYLFFFGKTSFSRETWLTALKKRFWTLFVPFVLWNIIAACSASIADAPACSQGTGQNRMNNFELCRNNLLVLDIWDNI